MSILMFSQDETSVLIVTDTLATSVTGEAFMFQSKAWHLPHFNMALAVTGTANLGADWNEYLRTSAVAQHLGMIDTFAPDALRTLWRTIQDAHGESGTATIYHFGFEPGSERIVRYVYRSTSDFESERTEDPGFGVKPPPETFELTVPYKTDEFIELATKIRAENDGGKTETRIDIGGELHMLYVKDRLAQSAVIHRFPDYDEHWREMIIRLNREQGAGA